MNGSRVLLRIVAAKSESYGLLSDRNNQGETPLHQAAKYGNIDMIRWLELIYEKPDDRRKKLILTDRMGRTPLNLAAHRGQLKAVVELLKVGSDPLKERDITGKTALHHVVANNTLKTHDAMEIIDALISHFDQDVGQKALFLWASAMGIGTADETKGLHPDLVKYLKKQKKPCKDINLLEEAARQRNPRLMWELLNRGGDIEQITRSKQTDHFRWVRRHIDKFSEQATDRPIRETRRDTLGRRVLAECIAAHFLNPYIESPVTVSITGGSGMGKTSMLFMIEAELLLTAAQLAFPYLWKQENFKGVKKLQHSEKGKRMCNKIEKGVKRLLAQGKEEKDNPLVKFLRKYRQKHESVYRYLACMDFRQLLETNEEGSKRQSLGAVPRILTVKFSAGNYREMNEAWAGLAVEITKAIENSMTRAQRLSTGWRHAWTRNTQTVYLKFIFPFLVIAFLAVWMLWAAWLVLEGSTNIQIKKLKYGSIPLTVVAILWYAFKAAISVFKPVSTQLQSYLRLPDHTQELGYQQKVISDIKFLMNEIGRKPNFIFSLITGENFMPKCLWEDNVNDTCIPKYGSAANDRLRIIAFVDDLDHCEEKAILQVLWAINLVFRECQINVVLSVDKNTIEAALKNSSPNEDEDFIDKFITKIIQLPVSLADPADVEWETFLEKELGHEPNLTNEKNCSSTDENQSKIEEPSASTDETDSFTDEGQEDDEEILRHPPPDQDDEISMANGQMETEYPCMTNINSPSTTSDDEDRMPNDVESGIVKYEGCIPSSYKMLKKGPLLENELPSEEQQIDESLYERIRCVRETLMQSFSQEEIKTFDYLRRYATGILKPPREWKCYISYHKFARNVIARKTVKHSSAWRLGNRGKHPPAWRLEFVAWTFVCSQWKREMNTLIQDWTLYTHNLEVTSLKDIVENYIKKRWPVEKEVKVDIGPSKKKKGSAKKKKEERERWKNLFNALREIQDVSFDGIECFQEFRFHCAPRYLKRPSLDAPKSPQLKRSHTITSKALEIG